MAQQITNNKNQIDPTPSSSIKYTQEFSSTLRSFAQPSIEVAGNLEDMYRKGYEFIHNSSIVNQVTTTNKTQNTFYIINDYVSNGPDANRPKNISRLEPGKSTPPDADTDVIIPLDSKTRFILPGGEITDPGEAIRTSGWGKVDILPVAGQSNVYHIQFKKGITPGGVSAIPNPITDAKGPFSHTNGIDTLRRTFR